MTNTIDEATAAYLEVTPSQFIHRYTLAYLELAIARSTFLSTWESIRLDNKSLANRTEEIRNFIAHGIDIIYRGAEPYARLVNGRYFSQSWEIGASRASDGLVYHKSHKHFTDAKKLAGLNKSLNVYNFVSSEYAKWFITTYAPSQLERGRELDGLTSAEISSLQQGLLKERSESKSRNFADQP